MGMASGGGLSDISQALQDGLVNTESAHTYLAKCIDNLLHTEAASGDELRDILHQYLPVFDQLVTHLPCDAVDAPYYRSIAAIIRGDYQAYLAETERFYAAKSTETPDWLDWPAADQYIVSIVSGLPVLGKWDDQIEGKIIRAHQKYAAKYFPGSAFDLYCKFWASKGSDQQRLKLLRDVLEKDPRWAWAWVETGDIYYNQKKWEQALDAYKHAMEDERTHFAALFFWTAKAAEQIKDWDAAAEYYQNCVELDPDCQYAQNNLGWCLICQKRYAESEPYLRYPIRLGARRE